MKLSQSLLRSVAYSCLAVAFTFNSALANGAKPAAAEPAPAVQQQAPAAEAPAAKTEDTAKAEDKAYEPQPGQQGKDVIWLPTAQSMVDLMLDLGEVTPEDYVIDLGSGDGRTVITAAKRGARALGIEYNPDMVTYAQRAAEKEGVTERATFQQADLFATDFSEATVLTMFLLPAINLKLRPQILDMKPGTRIVSNSFDMAEWEADRTERAEGDCTSYCTARLWIVPAKVDGTWKLDDGELTLNQEFQTFTGKLKTGNGEQEVTKGRLDGVNITFTAGETEYTGRVEGDAIEGTTKAGTTDGSFKATRGS